MAEFPEPQLAVLAAIEIQRRLFEHNQSRAEGKRLQVRAGINSGVGFRRGNDLCVVQNLIDCLEAGDTLDEFLDSFPSVTREQAVAALEIAREAMEERAHSSR